MPRKKEPISILEGKKRTHLTKQQMETRTKNETRMKPPTDRIRPPTWLSKEAKKEFRKVLSDLKRLQNTAKCDLITNLDVPLLAMWANAYAEYQKIDAIINIQGVVVETASDRVTAAAMMEHMKTLFSREKALFEQMEKIGRQFGFSTASRLSIVLPPSEEKTPESKWAKFGAGGGMSG